MTNSRKDIWYYCPTCSNYSLHPMECCGEMMIKDETDTEIGFLENFNFE